MISTPATGCCACSFCSNASAGGQDEQPSEVNNSTTTGLRPASAAEVCASASAARAEQPIKRARGSLNTAGKFLIVFHLLNLRLDAGSKLKVTIARLLDKRTERWSTAALQSLALFTARTKRRRDRRRGQSSLAPGSRSGSARDNPAESGSRPQTGCDGLRAFEGAFIRKSI